MTQNENNKPAHEIVIGSVKAAIWVRKSEAGGSMYSVTVSRLYRKDDKWNYSDSFRPGDLLLLGKVLDQAHTWIVQDKAPWVEDEPGE